MSKTLAMIEVGRIAPPDAHFELGDWIEYHHRACVARIPKDTGSSGVFGVPSMPARWEAITFEGGGPPTFPTFGDDFPNVIADRTKRNKTIMVWPEDGEGCIIGLIRRGIGRSYSGYTSGYYEPEWEPGGFEVEEWHWLYVVKSHILLKNAIYVPLWAASKR